MIEPLLEAHLLPDLDSVFTHASKIKKGQLVFRDALQKNIDSPAGAARVFLAHVKTFKQYSSFCVTHSRVTKELRKENGPVRKFFTERGTNMQDLDSQLIRPVQRILKYPLFLDQMKGLVRDEVTRSVVEEALKAIEKGKIFFKYLFLSLFLFYFLPLFSCVAR